MKSSSIFILSSIIFISQSFAADGKCPTWPSYYQPEFCNCGAQLKNLSLATPKNTNVMSACLEDRSAGGRRLIDLKKEKLNLENSNDYGEYPHGTIYLRGEMTISGEVIVDEGPSGVFWFKPQWEFSHPKTPFSIMMNSFKFLDENDSNAFKINEKLVRQGCSVAQATIRIIGFRVLIGGTDEAGTYPVGTKVINVGKYAPCAKKKS